LPTSAESRSSRRNFVSMEPDTLLMSREPKTSLPRMNNTELSNSKTMLPLKNRRRKRDIRRSWKLKLTLIVRLP